jgi:hypothetical protein
MNETVLAAKRRSIRHANGASARLDELNAGA